MPSEQQAASSAHATILSETQAVLKIVQNKIRNLRKAIDKAAQIEAAESRGEELQADQRESLRSKPVKVALLAELEEILKKQSATAVEYSQDSDKKQIDKSNRREARRRENEGDASVSTSSSAQDDTGSASEITTLQNSKAVAAEGQTSDGANALSEQASGSTSKSEKDESATHSQIGEALPSQIPNGKESAHDAQTESPVPSYSPEFELSTAISKVLSLLHIVDYIKADDAKASVLAYFESQGGQNSGRHVGTYELDVLSYFTVMLSSPNGDIAHPIAVETSSAHCLAYLQESNEEAFTGTTYATLAELVKTIATCPLVACRGAIAQSIAEKQQTQLAFGSGGLVAGDAAIEAPKNSAQWTNNVSKEAPAGTAHYAHGERGTRRGGRRQGQGGRGRGRGGGSLSTA